MKSYFDLHVNDVGIWKFTMLCQFGADCTNTNSSLVQYCYFNVSSDCGFRVYSGVCAA